MIPADPDLQASLAHVTGRVPPAEVDQVWIFPRRKRGRRASGLCVIVAYGDAARSDARRVFTLRYDVEPGRRGAERNVSLVEEGSAPAERITRIIEGVARRAEEDGVPVRIDVRGSEAAWQTLVAGSATVDESCGE